MPGAGGRRDGELLFNGYRASACQAEKDLEMDGSDGCINCESVSHSDVSDPL